MLLPITIASRLPRLAWIASPRLLGRQAVVAAAAIVTCLLASAAHGQVMVYEPLRPVSAYAVPMAAGYPGGYVANYSPAGNYAAVTAFSPPVATSYVANYPVPVAQYPVAQYPVTQVANYGMGAVSAPVAVTSYYAPAPVAVAPVVATPVYAAPVTTYYAPSAVAVPLYRRGLFGGLRPTRTAAFIPY